MADRTESTQDGTEADEEESDRGQIPATEDVKSHIAEYYVVSGTVTMLLIIGVASAQTSLINAEIVENLVSNPDFGYAVFPMLAAIISGLGIETHLELTNTELTQFQKAGLKALPVLVLTITAGVESFRPAGVMLSFAIMACGAIFWGRHGESGIFRIPTTLAGYGLAAMTGLSVSAVYL